MNAAATAVRSVAPARPPAWLVVATGLLAAGCLALAVAETNLWMHYVIDAGESISLIGLGFMLVSGLYLYTRRRLMVSLPLAAPWLLFPVITQGDQLIDNLSINWMRLIVHVLLGALFLMPVGVVVMASRSIAGSSRQPTRRGSAVLAAGLLLLEMWVAVRFLGVLMVVTLVVMIAVVLMYGFSGSKGESSSSRTEGVSGFSRTAERAASERLALALLLVGVVVSAGLFFGFKNRPGAYQGSPSYFMDPASQEGFELDRLPVPSAPVALPANPDLARGALTAYARALERLVGGYYILDRNYNYDFHNRLFWRSTPLLPDYRHAGLQKVHEADALWRDAEGAVHASALTASDPLGALMQDVRDYTTFTFSRAPVLEQMSGSFEKTEAGLQHATHLYEGEGKVVGVRLAELLQKHRAVLESPVLAPVTSEFATISRSVYDVYANRIVGF